MLDQYHLNALVVDDAATMRSMMKTQLTSLGVNHVVEAPNAAVAIEKLRHEKFELLLLDYYLGDATDGQQLLELIRNEKLVASSAVIVMVTAETNYGSVAKVAEHAPDAYVLKPFTADGLLEHILPVLQRKMGIRDFKKKTPGLKPIYDQYDAGHYDAVIALVNAYTEREGAHADTAHLKASSIEAKGDFVGALEFYRSLPSNYAWAALGIARMQLALHQDQEAIDTLEHVVQASPHYVHAADVLAKAYVKSNQVDKALPLLEATCARSPTVSRMRATARTAEEAGDFGRVSQWAGKVVDANKFAITPDYTDHARLVRSLVKTGQLDKAVSTMVAIEKESPNAKQSAAVQASKALMLSSQIEHEKTQLETMPQSIRDRRLGLLKEKEAHLEKIVEGLAELPASHEEAPFLSEAYMAVGREERSAEIAATAMANGQRVFEAAGGEEWRAQVQAAALQKTKARIVEGLNMLREGQPREALKLFMHLAEFTPPELTPQILANVVTTVVMLRQKGGKVEDVMPTARAALQRLKSQYPNYERLAGLVKAFEGTPDHPHPAAAGAGQ